MLQFDLIRYRRQFVAAFQPSDKFPLWRHCELAEDGLHIYAHPDLELTSSFDNEQDARLVLLGYAIDLDHPDRDNRAIIEAFIDAGIGSVEALATAVCELAGRFVLIAAFSGQVFVFHDACGLRSVFYAHVDGKTYLASQPLLFTEFFTLTPTDQYSEFKESSYVRHRIEAGLEFWLPCGIGGYENTFQLIPNHYLEMREAVTKRYWPIQPIAKQRYEDASRRSADMLSRLITALNSRYKVALSLSAGWDSRLLLAASKGIADDLIVYSHILEQMTENHRDVVIPKAIFEIYKDIEYKIIDCRTEIDPEFERVYNANVDLADQRSVKLAYEILKTLPQGMIAIKGGCGEITRCYYYSYGVHDNVVSPAQLANLGHWGDLHFVADYLGEWLNEAKEACAKANMDILDLFCWEHDFAPWLSQAWLEKDIAQESFSPYNYRPLLTTMLGVPTKYRREPDYLLYQLMIKNLWPELLNWPINPKALSMNKTIELRLRKLLLDLGLYGQVRRLYKVIKRFMRG